MRELLAPLTSAVGVNVGDVNARSPRCSMTGRVTPPRLLRLAAPARGGSVRTMS